METLERYDSLFEFYSPDNIPWQWLKAQAVAESDLNPKAVSPVGAKGLTQFMDATYYEWGTGDPFEPENSIHAQARYMEWLVVQLGDVERATAAYNAGIGRIKKLGNNWREEMPKETRDYLLRVNRIFKEILLEAV